MKLEADLLGGLRSEVPVSAAAGAAIVEDDQSLFDVIRKRTNTL